MNDVHLDLDLITDLAHGGGALTAEQAAHLLACPACRAEWELVHAAARFGGSEVAGFDGLRVAAQVHLRLLEAPAPSRPIRWWPVVLAVAATLLIGLWSTGPARIDPIPAAFPVDSALVLHELDSLDVAQLERVLADIPGETSHVEQLQLDDLTTEDLERVLRSMEE